jgi:membrane-bound inhibitor of C-type lysozyme
MSCKVVAVPLLTLASLMLVGCSSMSVDKVWPFGKEEGPGQPKRLANATEYQCEGGKRFHVRLEDNGNTAWLIFPDREVALAKQASATRYSNGVATLEINGAEATLKDGAATFNGCKAAGK